MCVAWRAGTNPYGRYLSKRIIRLFQLLERLHGITGLPPFIFNPFLIVMKVALLETEIEKRRFLEEKLMKSRSLSERKKTSYEGSFYKIMD